MMSELAAWSSRCDSVLGELEVQIATVKADAARRTASEKKADLQIKAVTKAADKNDGGLGLGLGRGGHNTRGALRRNQDDEGWDDDADGMDVDGGPGTLGGKKKGKGGGGFSNFMGKLGGRS
jgi:COP9 signalosome complex subunit 7